MKYRKIKDTIKYKNRADYYAGVIFSTIVALLSVSFAMLLQQFIDGIGQSMDFLLKRVWISVTFVVLFIACGFLANFFQHRYIRKASANIRNHVMDSILQKSSREINMEPQGYYLSILSNDITALEQNYIQASILIIVQCVMCIAGIIVMLYINWVMTLVVVGASLLPLVISNIFGVRLKKCQNVVSFQNSRYVGLVKDILGGNFVIKSFRVETRISNLNSEMVEVMEGAKEKHRRVFSNMQVLVQSSTFFIVFLIFILGAYLVKKELLTIGGIMAFLQLLNNVTGPIGQLSDNISKVKGCETILAKITKLESNETCHAEKIDKKHFARVISLQDVSFSYDDASENVLRNISYVFEKGKSYAIVGESGCGKSTLLKLINGYHVGYEGKIFIDDVEIKELSEDSVGKIFGSIQQDTFIFNTTIYNNVTMFEDWPKEAVQNAMRKSRLDKILAERGENMDCGELGCNLSGGERQRIAIARALLRNREILIMDEATSALDLENSSIVEQELLNMDGITRIVVTHKLNPSLLSNYDEILVMKNGQICEKGSYFQLINQNGLFAHLCAMAN